MYRNIFTLFAIFFCSAIFAQSDSLYAEFQIRSFSFEGKEKKLTNPKILVLKRIGCSEIVSLGYIDDQEIGLQIEIIKSSLGDTPILVTGKAFFLKKGGDWKMGSVISYQEYNYKKISDWSQLNDKEFSVGSFSVNKLNGEFQLNFRDRYYIVQ